MKVQLMLTCLCDAFYGEVGIAAVNVLEHVGCEVEFPAGQTCCGQPPFNAGDWDSSRRIADHAKSVFGQSSAPIVVPSASCTAMMREGYDLLYPGTPHALVYELSEFLHTVIGVQSWPQVRPGTCLAYHRSCHGRGIHLGDSAERLLALAGVDLIPFNASDQCCGFGGAFSVTHPKVSGEIGLEKLRQIEESGATELVSGDMGCLMHLGGLISRHSTPIRIRHYSQVLADALTGKEERHGATAG